jgi:hypothetical protein
MKAYGIPRNLGLVHPDCADIREFGLKSSVSNPSGLSGDRHNSFRDPASKASTRRYYKRLARREGKVEARDVE